MAPLVDEHANKFKQICYGAHTMALTKFILINANDNVLVCCQAANVGETVCIDERLFNITVPIDVGHKIAKENIKRSQKIIRYGVAIGSATTDIETGEHVHLHNIKSDYIPSHTRQSVVGD